MQGNAILQLQTFLQALDWEGKVKEKQEKKVLRKLGLEVKRKRNSAVAKACSWQRNGNSRKE